LEASKEELQSVNEELHTINAELNGKVEALDLANNDLQKLFESTNVATIVLDRRLLIRSFTPAVTDVFNILPNDRGRPITDLSSPFELPSFAIDIAQVLANGQLVERQIDHKTQRLHFLIRVAPYRDGSESTEGVVVTFIAITGLVEAEKRQLVLIAELWHRTRNLLAVVQRIAQKTLSDDAALGAFSDRLTSIGRVQGLISDALNEEISPQEIIETELSAIGVVNSEKVNFGEGVCNAEARTSVGPGFSNARIGNERIEAQLVEAQGWPPADKLAA
jgi:two-component system, chemotaxis family, CheB/CheR fusion protein